MKHRIMNFDAVFASSPLDSTAARVASGGRDEPADPAPRDPNRRSFIAPPQIGRQPDCLPNLVGRKVGRLTTLGWCSAKTLGTTNGKWLVRCSCGVYETRKTSALLKETNDYDACVDCKRTIEQRHGEYVRRSGQQKPKRDFV